MRDRRVRGIALSTLLATLLTTSALAMQDEHTDPQAGGIVEDGADIRSIDPGFVREFEDQSNDTGFVMIVEDRSNDTGFLLPHAGTPEPDPHVIIATPSLDLGRP